ncbi:hypothetical protein BKK56_04100 [Rodentibacter genomosp. 2]|nr:hypothetical protein BKK56_04100 [Rodentibacter genomosp. 2]
MLLPLYKANSLNDLILSLDFSLYYFEFREILSKLQQIHFIHSYITPQNSTSGFGLLSLQPLSMRYYYPK